MSLTLHTRTVSQPPGEGEREGLPVGGVGEVITQLEASAVGGAR